MIKKLDTFLVPADKKQLDLCNVVNKLVIKTDEIIEWANKKERDGITLLSKPVGTRWEINIVPDDEVSAEEVAEEILKPDFFTLTEKIVLVLKKYSIRRKE